MQLLLPVLLVTNILGLASACTQWQIQYKTKKYSCETDAGAYRNLCYQFPARYLTSNAENQGRLGTDITAEGFCDPCVGKEPRCYCLIKFWRYSEWVSSYIPVLEDDTWEFDPSLAAARFSSDTVDC